MHAYATYFFWDTGNSEMWAVSGPKLPELGELQCFVYWCERCVQLRCGYWRQAEANETCFLGRYYSTQHIASHCFPFATVFTRKPVTLPGCKHWRKPSQEAYTLYCISCRHCHSRAGEILLPQLIIGLVSLTASRCTKEQTTWQLAEINYSAEDNGCLATKKINQWLLLRITWRRRQSPGVSSIKFWV